VARSGRSICTVTTTLPTTTGPSRLQFRGMLKTDYSEVYTSGALDALHQLASFDADRKHIMTGRLERRAARAKGHGPLAFRDVNASIPRTHLPVSDARAGRLTGSEIPHDLRRQWIQGTGPAARRDAPTETSLRNIAYALLSGADGWMFDGEDALG